MNPIRLTGLVFALAAFLFYRSIRRARRRGHVGPRHRRIWRAEQPWRFRIALALEGFGALVCCVACYLCLTHTLHLGW